MDGVNHAVSQISIFSMKRTENKRLYPEPPSTTAPMMTEKKNDVPATLTDIDWQIGVVTASNVPDMKVKYSDFELAQVTV
ncbi:hypothetical protein GE061_001038 [Apolygus lucorum]|uniref:Uncharacterized protein n=1 Tax=Apolygus lucorum TaxID=248454 RepID=A0A8S9Y5X9_APOLU|nr:hypothetical protein GE061_001038 [Apolygus lucorum]